MRTHVALLAACLAPALVAVAGSEPSPEAVLAELPFLESEEAGRVLVDLAPPGSARPFRWMLDTGATHSVLTPGAARALGVRVRRTRQDPNPPHTRQGRDLLFYVDAASSDTGSKTGWEYGLLGGNFLADYVVELDFPGRRVRLLDPRAFEVPQVVEDEEQAVLALDVIRNRPIVELRVNGQPQRLLLDTGANVGLVLAGARARELGIGSRGYPGFGFGSVWGALATELGVAERLEFGPFGFGPLPTVVLPRGWFNMGIPDAAVVGVDLLSQFVVRLDYARGRLWLRRRKDARVTWNGEPWSSWEDAFADPAGSESPEQVAVAPGAGPARAGSPASGPSALPAPARAEEVWLELTAPAEGLHEAGPVAWLEVQGWAGSGVPSAHDVVVVVDVSGSTAWASGVDVDGDGKLGKARRRIDEWRTFNPRHYSSDAGDTVLAAELAATRRLVELLDPERTRLGLVSFSGGAELLAPVGSDAPTLGAALDALERNFGSGATNLAAATRTARRALLDAGDGGRHKSILILSDGYPTMPGSPELAAQEAYAEAERAAAQGVRITSFALGLEEVRASDVFAAMAECSGGEHVRLEQPGEIVHELPLIDLARVAGVELLNLGTGQAGRAVRVHPDGSFDGFVELAPGENTLQVVARGRAGGARTLRRRVFFEPREPRDAQEALAFEAQRERLCERLALRSLESELAAEARAARAARSGQRRELDVEPEREPTP